MNGASKGTLFLSGTLGLFRSTPRKINKTTARRNGSKVLAKKSRRNSREKINPYQAAEIEFDPGCACDAVKRMAGQRFLVRNVPPIPVPECDSPECKCSYIRYKDRRLWTEDRRTYYGLGTDLYRKGDKEDRRKQRDRRVSEESSVRTLSSIDDFETLFK